ncbi:murein biosynthesis integral membrane protein MurJ [Leucobacter soli]|uniref:Peptidoglycan biosynthesis protein MviN n=1 Tax=Leucobacter soli TaxID=2812850 RepID=A0A916NEL7_9MICO|nr:murein biosynthesis integral membrane protein MurJ [Leucobacter soli]CAG7597807.1 putative peptidoglycan biosynthesis protein MviN [Leucobacter soli]
MAAGLVRASAVMASGTMVSRILGFVKAMLLVYAIGQLSQSADAFANGNQLPSTLYMVLAGGMLNAVLVPQIVKAAQGKDGGSGYINKVLTLVSVALLAITTLAMLAAPAIVWVLTLSWDADQRALAVAFSYWCIPQVVFYGWYTVLGEVLNAKKVFGPFTWAPALANVIAIIGTVVYIALFGASNDPPIDAWTPASIAVLAGSATLGVAAQALILIWPWRRAGLRFRPDFTWRGVGLGQTGRIAGWGLASILVLQLGGVVTTNVINSASGQGPSLTAMTNAWLVFMLPHSVIAVSLMTAHFTELSEFGQSGRMDAFRTGFSDAAKQIAMLMVFAAAAMFMAAPFVSRVLWPSGSPEDVQTFAYLLQFYSLGLAAYSVMFAVQRAFYALSDARTPFIFMAAQLVALIALTVPAAFTVQKGLLGFVYAGIWSFTTILQVLLALWLLRRRLGRIGGADLLVSVIRYLVAVVPALAVGLFLVYVCRSSVPDFGLLLAVVFALVCAAAMGLVYFAVLLAVRAPEARALLARLRRR